jgi:PPIC-type PPIASE domain
LSNLNSSRWRRWLLIGGIVGGLSLAALNALTSGGGPNPDTLPPGAIARVNNSMILRSDYVRALNAVSSGKRNVLTPEDKAAILQRLIEEELLIQRSLETGLATEDPALRNALVSAMTRDIIARNHSKAISPVVLRDYYYKNKARYARPARVFVRAIFLPAGSAPAQMDAFNADLKEGMPAKTLQLKYGENTPPIPEGLIPLQKLNDYIGPAPLAALPDLSTGQWSPWIKGKTGVWRLYLVNRTRQRIPELSSVKAQVEATYLTDRDDANLRRYLKRLKRNARIGYSADAPQ